MRRVIAVVHYLLWGYLLISLPLGLVTGQTVLIMDGIESA
jgi:hypothetical protein